MKEQRIILDLCGGSGSWARPYKQAGYDVRLITLPTYDVTKIDIWFLKKVQNIVEMEQALRHGLAVAELREEVAGACDWSCK